MDEITVSKERLLDTLRENMQQHEAAHQIAMNLFRETAAAELRKRADEVESGRRTDLRVDLPVPVNHSDSYKRAIAMLEWEIGDEITLDRSDFNRFVLDEWEFAVQVAATNSFYGAK